MHPAGTSADCAHRETGFGLSQVVKVDQLVQRSAQPARQVIRGLFDADLRHRTPAGEGIRLEKSRDAECHGSKIGQAFPESRHRTLMPDPVDRHPVPEFAQPRPALLERVAGDDRRVDRADRRPDDPVGFQTALVQSLVHAQLIGAQRAAALLHQNDLTGNHVPAHDCCRNGCVGVRHRCALPRRCACLVAPAGPGLTRLACQDPIFPVYGFPPSGRTFDTRGAGGSEWSLLRGARAAC